MYYNLNKYVNDDITENILLIINRRVKERRCKTTRFH